MRVKIVHDDSIQSKAMDELCRRENGEGLRVLISQLPNRSVLLLLVVWCVVPMDDGTMAMDVGLDQEEAKSCNPLFLPHEKSRCQRGIVQKLMEREDLRRERQHIRNVLESTKVSQLYIQQCKKW